MRTAQEILAERVNELEERLVKYERLERALRDRHEEHDSYDGACEVCLALADLEKESLS